MHADTRATVLAHDSVRPERDKDDAAVADIGYGHQAIGQLVRVIRLVQIPPLAAAQVYVAILPGQAMRTIVDAPQGLRLFLIGDDCPPVRREEGIVGS